MIVAILRHRATAGVTKRGGTEIVVLRDNEGRTRLVLSEEWAKVLPFIQDGSFNSLLTPSASKFGYLDRNEAFSEPVVDRADVFLYKRILATLKDLFPETYPTSSL